MQPVSTCRSASIQNFAEIGQSVDELWPKTRFSRWRPPPSRIIKISIFGHEFNIWCSIPSFNKIGQFFTEIWRFNDFQNGGRPPSWILKIYSFCYAARIEMSFCFLIQNFAEIGQFVDELWPKNRFSRWRPPSWILKISILVTWLSSGSISDAVYQVSSNRMIFHWDMAI